MYREIGCFVLGGYRCIGVNKVKKQNFKRLCTHIYNIMYALEETSRFKTIKVDLLQFVISADISENCLGLSI